MRTLASLPMRAAPLQPARFPAHGILHAPFYCTNEQRGMDSIPRTMPTDNPSMSNLCQGPKAGQMHLPQRQKARTLRQWQICQGPFTPCKAKGEAKLRTNTSRSRVWHSTCSVYPSTGTLGDAAQRTTVRESANAQVSRTNKRTERAWARFAEMRTLGERATTKDARQSPAPTECEREAHRLIWDRRTGGNASRA